MGTPIINQPQLESLLGSNQKVPAVIETDKGDFIGIRRKMILSIAKTTASSMGQWVGCLSKR